MSIPILTTDISSEYDVVLARQRAWQIAAQLGFDAQDQTRIATAVSEIARNAYQYASGGRVSYELDPTPATLLITVRDRGPGIARLSDVLDGRYRSATGMGLGILGARRLGDRFEIDSSRETGTTVVFGKLLPTRSAPVTSETGARVGRELARAALPDPIVEIRAQNQELLRALAESAERQAEVERLNHELAETNRGVLALYAELDEKAADLARASELKSRFLSNISHELRTPLNAILNITRLLQDRIDGPLTDDQDRQVRFVRAAAANLSEMVNDLLDLARIEAGRSVVRPVGVHRRRPVRGAPRHVPRTRPVGDRGDAARRPRRHAAALHRRGQAVADPAQLHRQRGQVHRARRDPGARNRHRRRPGHVRRHRHRHRHRAGRPGARSSRSSRSSTAPCSARRRAPGWGLPLSRKLAELLGGQVAVSSTLGVGSTFSVTIPARYAEPRGLRPGTAGDRGDPACLRPSTSILVVDDNEAERYYLSRILAQGGLSGARGRHGIDGLRLAERERPELVTLDVRLPDINGFEVCRRIKSDPATRDIPVIHISASFTTPDAKAEGLDGGADGYLTHPVDPNELLATLRARCCALAGPRAQVRAAAREWTTTFDLISDPVCLTAAAGPGRSLQRRLCPARWRGPSPS